MLDIKNGSAAGAISVTGDLGKISVNGGDLTSAIDVGGGLKVLQVNAVMDKATKALNGGNMGNSHVSVGGLLSTVKLTGDLTDGHLQAGRLSKVLVKNQISAAGEGCYIHANSGSFLIKDADDKLLIDDAAG